MRKRVVCRVVLLYHDPLLRDIVRQAFDHAADIGIVAELPAAKIPLADLVAVQPDVVVIDRRVMDDTLPSSLLATLAEHQPGIRIITLSLAEAGVTVFSGWQVSGVSIKRLVACVRDGHPSASGRGARRGRRRAEQAR